MISTSNSPAKYYYSKKWFSPKNEEIILLIYLVYNNNPRPKLSTPKIIFLKNKLPALLDTHVN